MTDNGYALKYNQINKDLQKKTNIYTKNLQQIKAKPLLDQKKSRKQYIHIRYAYIKGAPESAENQSCDIGASNYEHLLVPAL